MLLKIIPLLFLIFGTGAGVGAGLFLSSKLASPADEHPEPEPTEKDGGEHAGNEFVRLNNQFVVPIIQKERVASLVVMSLSLETRVAMSDEVYKREPKLRDSFLRVLFDHANMGGFDGSFTQSDTLDVLRRSLKDVARYELGDDIADVLITDIARQDN